MYTFGIDRKVYCAELGEPKKLSNILAALSASPGKLNPCTKSREPLATLVELSFANAVAWIAAFCAPARNFSRNAMDVKVEGNRLAPPSLCTACPTANY